MVSLCLTVEDLARVRFVGTLGPELEARFAEARFTDARPDEFAEWRRRVRRRLRSSLSLSAAQVPSHRRRSMSTPGLDAHRFHAAAIEPFWGRIRDCLESEREMRGRSLLSDGVEGVLNDLHPAIRWDAPYLDVDNGQDVPGMQFVGDGLVLAPSLFAPGPLVLDAETGGKGAPVLVYNVRPAPESVSALWEEDEDRAASLRDLLGNTRASVLESVRSPSSTGEISRRLRISNPSASKHLGVLRRSGLVATERRNNLTVHRLTYLGEAVLGRQD